MSNWQEPVAFLHPAVLLFGEVTMRWYLTEELNKRCPKTTNEAKTTALTPGDLTYLLIRRISRHQWDDKEMGTMPARIVILTLFRGYINDLLFATTISRSGWIVVVCNIFMGEDLLAMMGAITRNYKHAIIMKKIENAPRKNNIKNHLWSLKSCRKNSICHEKKKLPDDPDIHGHLMNMLQIKGVGIIVHNTKAVWPRIFINIVAAY